MIVLVSDTSVLIDLDRGGLLEAAFACGHQMVVPQLLYDRELAPENGPLLCALGLQVIDLTSEEVEFAQSFQHANLKLSLPDCMALSCARRPGHMLVTGDKNLRTQADNHDDVRCHGLLWLLDQMESSGAISRQSLAEGLQRISAHPRCRLPKQEVSERVQRWCKESN
jgi:hypothetical protein